MATQTLTYCTTTKLGCCPETEVIICVPTVLVVSGLGFLDATMTGFEQTGVSCGNTYYTYTFEYDDTQLVTPETPLVGSEVSGIICRDCLTRWVEESAPYALTGWATDEDGNFYQETGFEGAIVFDHDQALIAPNTGIGTNTKTISLCGGFAASALHGSYITVTGINTLDAGDLNFFTSINANADFNFYIGNATGFFVIRDSSSTDVLDISSLGNVRFNLPVGGVEYKSGANGRTGTFTLNGATPVVVNNTSLSASDRIIIVRDIPAGTPGAFSLTVRTNGASFTVTGTAADTSGMAYFLVKVN